MAGIASVSWPSRTRIVATVNSPPRSCSPVMPAAGGRAGRGRGGDPAAPGKEATRSGDLRGSEPEREEAERALLMADPCWGDCAHFEALRLCAQHRVTRPGNQNLHTCKGSFPWSGP
jgi:hypothetical protein